MLTLNLFIRLPGPVCDDPLYPGDAVQVVSQYGYAYGAEVDFNCTRPDFAVASPSTLTCINGTHPEWDYPLPVCVGKSCAKINNLFFNSSICSIQYLFLLIISNVLIKNYSFTVNLNSIIFVPDILNIYLNK